ncbi:MAG: NUDIX domain-containing protein [Methanobacteriota archaeon]|nr:MAG: NUDIX domain-containing protein [Euryarchaeota archaeon]TLZ96654.1 MAG: NUDIX domain-containing protein [Euryarchaeota archaeon]TMA01618.1 MAG: NUDIX domain-containing protein [Euryarchaeota archaeon]
MGGRRPSPRHPRCDRPGPRGPGIRRQHVVYARGLLEQGERTDDGLRREAREEVGLELADPALTRIVHETITDGSRARHGYFAQFIARAQSTELRPGHEVIEARWFDGLPRDMAFRDDYLEDFRKIQAGASF